MTAGDHASGMKSLGLPVPSALVIQTSVLLAPSPWRGRPYITWLLFSHSTWSSTLRVSDSSVALPVARSYTARCHWPTGSPLRVLNATRVPSGETDGHSASSRSAVSVRAEMLPLTSHVFWPEAAVAKKWSSSANVTPQRLRFLGSNGLPSTMSLKLSMLSLWLPSVRLMRVSVENWPGDV